jgi:hypothetical protein
MPEEGSRAVLVGHCPNCKADRNAEVLAEDTLGEEPSGRWSISTYSILRCLGCDRRYIRLYQASWDDLELVGVDPETGEACWEDKGPRVTYWPSPPRRPRRFRVPSDYPELAALLAEVYTALDNDLRILTTVGIRTVFDCAAQLLGCDPNQKFADKLKELAAGNKISGEEKEILWVLTDAGSAAAHRGWKPSEEHLDSLMDALENFVHRTFVLKHQLREVKKIIPPKVAASHPRRLGPVQRPSDEPY